MGIKRVSRANSVEQRLRTFERLTEREVLAILETLGGACRSFGSFFTRVNELLQPYTRPA